MNTPNPRSLLSCSLLLLLLLSHRGLPQTASIEALGVTTRGGNADPFGSISADGKAVVGTRRVDGIDEAFIWREGTGGQRLDLPSGGVGPSRAHSISDDGRIVVGTGTDSAGRTVPVRWVDSEPEWLPLPPGTGSGRTAKVSRDGRIIFGTVGPTNRIEHVICRWGESLQPEVISDSPVLRYGLNPWGLTLSPDGSVIALTRGSDRHVFRWSADVGFVELKLGPGTHAWDHPGRWTLTMTGDASVLGMPYYQKRGFKWTGMGDGEALPIILTPDSMPTKLFQVSANHRGSLLVGAAAVLGLPLIPDSVVVPPYGPLSFEEVLRAQGCDLGGWTSITNAATVSPDGQWVTGWGVAAAREDRRDSTAYRARLVLHDAGPSRLTVQTLPGMHRLRWPATDLLVRVESTPKIHPGVPWVAESGSPRIEGNEIVLDLESVTTSRFFRLRRVD